MHITCPRGLGALKNVLELANDLYLARQPSVSGPKLDDMINVMRAGHWTWSGSEIKANGNVIIDGHHRYIAARIADIEPVIVPSVEPYARTFRWGHLNVSPTRW